MRGRLCRHCGSFVSEDEGLFHVECGKRYEREKSRRRRARKGTTSQRGYGSDHQRLRALAITQQPWCSECGSTDNLEADHIVPLNRGGANVLSNYRVLCKAHNVSKADRVTGPPKPKPRFSRKALT
jgi:5-methylcytosine-specific restriction endonuclease McrA